MKILLQRVSEASCIVDERITGKIGKGILVYLGIGKDDSIKQIEWLADKIVNLRIFEDESGKMNLSLKDVKGEILVVSQFTLYGNCKRGRRPDFASAAKPELAKKLYEQFIDVLKEKNVNVQTGIFGAHMIIQSGNDGPINLILEK